MTDLATAADLEKRLGRSLTTTEATRAAAYLTDASAMIRSYTNQTFTAVTGDVITLRAVGTKLRLPQRPVTAVTSVVAVGWGTVPDLTLPVGFWGWDGIDIVEVEPFNAEYWLSLPSIDLWYGEVPETYRVTYNHGDATIPDDVVAVCAGMVLRVLLSPSPVEGLNTERIGQYSYGFQQGGGGSAGVTVRMSEQDKDALHVAGYGPRKSGTVQVKL